MGCVFIFSENYRAQLFFILAIINWLSVLIGIWLIAIGTYIKLKISEYTNLVKEYDADSLPYLLIAVGLATTANTCGGGFVAFMMSNPLKRKAYRYYLVAYIIASILTSVFIVAGGILCFFHIQKLGDSFHGGLIKAMGKYKDTLHLKVEIDQLQMYFSCCGNEGFADWAKLSWNSITPNQGHQGKITDSVPFSCCNPHVQRPCIHHNIHQDEKHQSYKSATMLTLHTTGCREALMDFFGKLLTNCGVVVVLVFFFHIALIIVSRFLHTAVEGALNSPDPLAPSLGYLFGTNPPEEDGDETQLLVAPSYKNPGSQKQPSSQKQPKQSPPPPPPQDQIYQNWQEIGGIPVPQVESPVDLMEEVPRNIEPVNSMQSMQHGQQMDNVNRFDGY